VNASAKPTASTQVKPPETDKYAVQEIRIAAVLNGGVSLAIWMSGVTLELHHLALSSQEIKTWPTYREVLRLLGATARVDVIAGTSAGGINGAFLAFALTHRRDLALLRDVWTDSGSLETLLRPGGEKNLPSLLSGDDYFLPQIQKALRDVVSDTDNGDLGSGRLSDNPIDLILTGTLFSGRETAFTDDMGVGITERDYDARFNFTRASIDTESGSLENGNLDNKEAVISQLAAAARCTSSFPGAFEPHFVKIDDGSGVGPRWPSNAGQTNFSISQYVIDGGVLLNKPVRPALEAIYKQTGENQIRRVLAYIVPDAGEPPTGDPASAPISDPKEPGPVPQAGDVLLSVITRLKSTDSISRELSEIRDRNASVRSRRRARGLLSMAMVESANLPEQLWEGYRVERATSTASTVAGLIASGQDPRRSRWSERELTEALLRFARSQPKGFPFVPSGKIRHALAQRDGDWTWGQTTAVRLGDQTVDVLKRVLWFARLDDSRRSGIVEIRGAVNDVLKQIRKDRASLNQFWARIARGGEPTQQAGRSAGPAIPQIPERDGRPNSSATNLDALDEWLTLVVPAWDTVPPDTAAAARINTSASSRREATYQQVHALAEILVGQRANIKEIIDHPNLALDLNHIEIAELRALDQWLFKEPTVSVGEPPAARAVEPSADAVLRQMLQLDVVQFATAGAASQLEQEVELVQVSASNPAVITGMQLHHFGAFYRAPWRVNDWIEGRLDGAKQIIRFLLSPERLRQCGYTRAELVEYLRAIAVPADSPYQDYLASRWESNAQNYLAEVDSVIDGSATVSALDGIADALAMPIRLQALAEDLTALADAIRKERTDAEEGSSTWLVSYDAKIAASGKPLPDKPASSALSASSLWDLRMGMKEIGAQKITDDVGSDTFARTVSHAATVAAGTFVAPPKVGKVKAVQFAMSALRGYTAIVWTMVSYLTRGSFFGTRAVELAVAIGGTLLATTLLVPAVPLGVTLAGVLLLFSGVTAAALRTPGGSWFGARLGVVTALFAVCVGFFIRNDIQEKGWAKSDTQQTLVKGGVVLVVVLLGWWIAQSRPTRKEGWSIGILTVAALATLVAVLSHQT
jgi:patatin-related protein